MGERVTVAAEDEGKPVVGPDGERVGVVASVRAGRAFVDPDPSEVERYEAKLGWEDVDEWDRPLPDAAIDRITDAEIRLRRSIDDEFGDEE